MSLLRLARYLWAAPATVVGLSLAPLVLLQGGQVRILDGVVEISGGIVTRLLRSKFLPLTRGAAALTLGHVIWGRDQQCLDNSRKHEHVHVRQYEQWGPFFLPAYFLASFLIYLRGGNAYLDNPFEREAYDLAP